MGRIRKLNPAYQAGKSANKLRSIRKRQFYDIFQSFTIWIVKQYIKGQLPINIQDIFYQNQATQDIKLVPINQALLCKPRDLWLPTISDVQLIVLCNIHTKFPNSPNFSVSHHLPSPSIPFLLKISIVTHFYTQWNIPEALLRTKPRDYGTNLYKIGCFCLYLLFLLLTLFLATH